jgi:hypothetical protein
MQQGRYGPRTAVLAAAVALALGAAPADAQTRFMYLSGQTVTPAYEGWWPNDDGSYRLFFGYMNSNWEQEYVIPVGRQNYFAYSSPGGLDDTERDAYDASVADQGQPTHFYPRRNPFLYTIDVPADFGTNELVWTLQSQGRTIRAYGTLASDYRIDPQVISTEVGGDFGSLRDALRTNIPPVIDIEGSLRRTVRVGERLTLVVHAEDPDNLPARRSRGGMPTTAEQLYRPPSSIVSISGPGLRFSWTVYRGDAEEISFDPVQMKTWTDTRVYANSPWSPPWVIPEPPPGNDWITEAVFHEPGEYTLRAVASDGSIFSYENLIVTVTPLLN